MTSIAFDPVTTSMKADSVRWYVDNVQKGTATGTNKTWKFTWNLDGVQDGTYQVRAQAYDRYGQTGAGYVVTIVLNRFAPAAPANVFGGRNPLWGQPRGARVGAEPRARRQRLRGLSRQGRSARARPTTRSSARRQVTDADATTCQDPRAPIGNQQYYVVALGPPRPPATGVDRSSPSALIQTDGDVRPTAPASVTATALPGGGVTADLDRPPATATARSATTASTATTTSPTSARYDRTDTGATLEWSDDCADGLDPPLLAHRRRQPHGRVATSRRCWGSPRDGSGPAASAASRSSSC